ncbi:MAG: hypothetical protein R2715_01745 [Ilumatobacteraceae bacterium]
MQRPTARRRNTLLVLGGLVVAAVIIGVVAPGSLGPRDRGTGGLQPDAAAVPPVRPD